MSDDNSPKVPNMQQANLKGRALCGGKADNIADCRSLAKDAWGELGARDDSGLTAFAYMWRRFGPPWHGCDDHKDLVGYYLTTADPDVLLGIRLSSSPVQNAGSYLSDVVIHLDARQPFEQHDKKIEEFWWSQHPEFSELEDTEENSAIVSESYWKDRFDETWMTTARNAVGPFPERVDPKDWRSDNGIYKRVNQALFDAMQELLRPVYIRDGAINIFGRCKGTDTPAEISKYAGYGVPQEAMDKLIESENDE